MAAQEVGRAVEVEVGGGGDEDALVAVVQVQVGARRRALDVEDIVAAAQVDVEGLEAVVVDAVGAGAHHRGRAFHHARCRV